MDKITNSIFKQQIKDDIKLIQERLYWAANVKKDEYAFNYWVLSNIYNLDEDVCNDNITEYNDKGIDCFVHYEEDKKLYIIQNKYYEENTPLDRKEVADFLASPLAALNAGDYEKSPELQEIYNKAKKGEGYNIFLHFYVTNDKKTNDIENIISDYNNNPSNIAIAEIFYLSDINDKYYGKSYKEGSTLEFNLMTKEGGLQNITSNAFYVMTTVQEVYRLWKQAEVEEYPLFEKNIREYLGDRGINGGIIKTLNDPKERNKFLYYNNGITIICREATTPNSYSVDLTHPQIVNGCQTVNSIAEVFKNKDHNDEDFQKVYVTVKILMIKDEKDEKFYENVVTYTNSQNSINAKVFGAADDMFPKIQAGIKKLGFLLCVKQSDKHTFKKKYEDEKKSKEDLLNRANKSSGEFYKFKTITDVQINLEHLLQIIGAFVKDAHFAYTKKSVLLLQDSKSKEYENFSLKIKEWFTTQQMVNLILLYKRAEFDKRRSDDKRTPASYYLLNFLGFYLNQKGIKREDFLENVTIDGLKIVYEQFKGLSKKYNTKCGLEYNKMLKTEIDQKVMGEVLNSHLKGLEEHAPERYEAFEKVFSGLKS